MGKNSKKSVGSHAAKGNETRAAPKGPICIRCPDPASADAHHTVEACTADADDSNLWAGFKVDGQKFNSNDVGACTKFLQTVQDLSIAAERFLGGDTKALEGDRAQLKFGGKPVTRSDLSHAFSVVVAAKQTTQAEKTAERQKAQREAQAASDEAQEAALAKKAAEKRAIEDRPFVQSPVLALPTAISAPTGGAGATTQQSNSVIPDFEQLKKDQLFLDKYALRKSFVTANKPLELVTNHFQVKLPKGLTLYEYVLSSESDEFKNATKNKRKVFMRDAIKQCPQLRDHIDEIATDNKSKIVSGKDLGISYKGFGIQVKSYHRGTRDEPTDVPLSVKFSRSFNMNTLQSYVEGRDMTYEEKGAAEAMNIIVAKAVSSESASTFQSGNNKFYYRPGWSDIVNDGIINTQGLVAIRGYYCSVRPAMDLVTMNINTVTSAFYKPQSLEKFLEPIMSARQPGPQHDQELREANEHLAGLRVWVKLDRATKEDPDIDLDHRRTKTIQSIDTFARLLPFTPKQEPNAAGNNSNPTNVWDHLTQKYRGPHGPKTQVSVNVGGKGENHKFYLPRHLNVLSDQIYRGKLPSHLVAGMIGAARRRPAENRAVIMKEGLSSLRLDNDNSMLKKLGIDVNPEMLQIPARRAPQPTVRYFAPSAQHYGVSRGGRGRGGQHIGRGAIAMRGGRGRGQAVGEMAQISPDRQHKEVEHSKVERAQWSTDRMVFVDTPRTRGESRPEVHFIMMKHDPTHPIPGRLSDGYRKCFKDAFVRWHSQNGLQKFELSGPDTTWLSTNNPADWTREHILNVIRSLPSTVQLVVLMIPTKGATYAGQYATFKAICDQNVGITSAVLCEDSIIGSTKKSHEETPSVYALEARNHSILASYMGNIAAKLNLRLGGTNQTLARHNFPVILRANAPLDCIIMGADVTHPSGTSVNGTPSLAAVVGSVDDKFGMFPGSMRYQSGRQEQIENMNIMARECFSRWSLKQTGGKSKNQLPRRILFYRDGVSEGQYDMVLSKEVNAIIDAWQTILSKNHAENASLPSAPQITAVVVAKRHHTRFFPRDVNDKDVVSTTGNLKPGTIVDSVITNPYYFDFYLQSHHSLQGTAKPAHYFVLKNDMNFTEQQLQDLTNNLCYTYGKSCNAVSYAPPAYYADRLCERGRAYLKPLFDGKHELRELAKNDPKGNVIAAKVKEMWKRGSENGGNPWHENLNNTMFWM